MLKRRLLLLGTLGLTVLAGCKSLEQLVRGAFQKPKLTFRTARLQQASLADATVDLVYELENPNPIGLSLASVDYAFFVEGKQVVAGAPQQGLQIASRGKSQLVFPANVRFADIVPVVQTFLTQKEARYRAQGSVGIQTPLGVLRFPLEHEGTFPVPQIPQVQLESPRIANLSLSGATVEFPLTVTNGNGFPLPLNGLAGNFAVAGNAVGQVSTGDMGMLEAGATRQVVLPLTINFARAAAAAKAFASGSGQVRFDARLNSSGQEVPVNLNQLLNFRR
jgi:LEA14-like dessication related protein